eukprot:4957501-Heterocapsa_arctica.AAC.1
MVPRPDRTALPKVDAHTAGRVASGPELVGVLPPPVAVADDLGHRGVEGGSSAHVQGEAPGRRRVQAAQERQLVRMRPHEGPEGGYPHIGLVVALGVTCPSERPLDGVKAIHASPHGAGVELAVGHGHLRHAAAGGDAQRLGVGAAGGQGVDLVRCCPGPGRQELAQADRRE